MVVRQILTHLPSSVIKVLLNLRPDKPLQGSAVKPAREISMYYLKLAAMLLMVVLATACAHILRGDPKVNFEEAQSAYMKGDYATALKKYIRAAERGNIQAQLNLGLMYQTGKGVPKNDGEALKWYRRAAETINREAPGVINANGFIEQKRGNQAR